MNCENNHNPDLRNCNNGCNDISICKTIREGQTVTFVLHITPNNDDCCTDTIGKNSKPCCASCYNSTDAYYEYLPECETTIERPQAVVNIVNVTNTPQDFDCEDPNLISKCTECAERQTGEDPCDAVDANKILEFYFNQQKVEIPADETYYYYKYQLTEINNCCGRLVSMSILDNPNFETGLYFGTFTDENTVYAATQQVSAIEDNFLFIRTKGKKADFKIKIESARCSFEQIIILDSTPGPEPCKEGDERLTVTTPTLLPIWEDSTKPYNLTFTFFEKCCDKETTIDIFDIDGLELFEISEQLITPVVGQVDTYTAEIEISVKPLVVLENKQYGVIVRFTNCLTTDSIFQIEYKKKEVVILNCEDCPPTPIDCEEARKICPPVIIDNTRYFRIAQANSNDVNVLNCESVTQKFVYTIDTNVKSWTVVSVNVFSLENTIVESYDICDEKVTVFVKINDDCTNSGYLKVTYIDELENLYYSYDTINVLGLDCECDKPDDCCNFPCEVTINYTETYKDESRIRIKMKVTSRHLNSTIEAILVDDWNGKITTNVTTINIQDGAEIFFELQEGTWEDLSNEGTFFLQVNFLACQNNTIYIPIIDTCNPCNIKTDG